MNEQNKTVRLQVRLTVTQSLERALERKAKALHMQPKDAIHQALVNWVAEPVAPVSVYLAERVGEVA